MAEAVILSAVRTPIGRFLGGLADVPAPRLGAVVVREAVRRAGVRPEEVDEVILGNILSAGLGQAPARQAARYAGLPDSVGAVTVNKMCGSGLKAVVLAAQAVRVGDGRVYVAGGMENMSRAPYLLPRARTGYRLGHGEVQDSMILDGLWDPYRDCHMGSCAELLAAEYRISREEQDAYAERSYRLALRALDAGWFRPETVPVESDGKRVEEDEEPRRVQFDRIPTLKPAFEPTGTVTAANASSISDGAAALVVAERSVADRVGVRPLARVVGYAQAATAPEWFTIAPAAAIERLLERVGWRKEDVDLYEVNEAFAAVVLGVCRKLGLSLDPVNVHGGAVALGHPIGASGARILTTLLHAMQQRDARRGVAAICLGGGEAVAVAVEREA
ncbi:MAG: thiolase family protein [Armatimonadota bacterium]|nr:thiolase family protein [Armatimonadota bacterium]MDR5676329.1 thiolase family protein [Armatimonadota bacterium]MDR5690016.1 thiolase family protein [Armatimonadota bacterium]MDR7386249.1 thiolase family protein [Armatimonadota bacterium]MDR7389106.1 thiolase family protein [Armatimonadota bacterium]